jgi:hypothetical protein
MGKSFKRYDKFDSFESHHPRDDIYHDKLKSWHVKKDKSIHKDRKVEALDSLAGSDDAWRED